MNISLRDSSVINSMLGDNYLPKQKSDLSEMPPIFDSYKFSLRTMASVLDYFSKNLSDFTSDVIMAGVGYRVSGPKGKIRNLTAPHPGSYVKTVDFLARNANVFDDISPSESKITPALHDDGRIMIINYGGDLVRSEANLDNQLGKNFRVHADIKDCFGSISVKAIAAAFIECTKDREKRYWSDDDKENFEKYLISLNDGRETGLPVGPATSNYLAELVLSSVDRKIDVDEFTCFYSRFIDDYIFYCETHEQAESFISSLTSELYEVGLEVNLSKTKIVALPHPEDAVWILDLSMRVSGLNKYGEYIEYRQVIRYLDYAILLSKEYESDGVLKYALKTVVDKVAPEDSKEFLDYLLVLLPHYPELTFLLDSLINRLCECENSILTSFMKEQYDKKFDYCLNVFAKDRRSDAMCWLLYFMGRCNFNVSEFTLEEIIKSEDCFALLSLCVVDQWKERVIEFLSSLKPSYEVDGKYWVLKYQLYLEGCEERREEYEGGLFGVLENGAVSFINKKVVDEMKKYSIKNKYLQKKKK